MRLRFYKHDVDFVDLELGGDGDWIVGMGMKFITVSFSNADIPPHGHTVDLSVISVTQLYDISQY